MSNRTRLSSAILVLAIATGCAHRSIDSKASSEFTISSLNAKANDQATGPDERCLSIFSLFRDFIKPGSGPNEIHAALTDTRWLEQTNILGIYVLAGWIPVDWEFGKETPFVVSVLPRIKPSSGRPPNLGYHVYFTLAGGASRSAESAFAILTGQQRWNTNAVIREFALCYPDGTIECVTRSGVRRFNQFGQVTRPNPFQARAVNRQKECVSVFIAERVGVCAEAGPAWFRVW